MGTGWFAADAANVNLARQLRWSVMARSDYLVCCPLNRWVRANHCDEPSRVAAEARPRIRRDDIVTERGDEGVARIVELTNGVGADSVLECVGTQESMMQAIIPAAKVDM